MDYIPKTFKDLWITFQKYSKIYGLRSKNIQRFMDCPSFGFGTIISSNRHRARLCRLTSVVCPYHALALSFIIPAILSIAHAIMFSTTGMNERARSVSEYSTLGGTSA